MKKIRIIAAAAMVSVMTPCAAADFFDTSMPDAMFSLGARIGVNTSNRTVAKNVFNTWNKNSWGTGFELGFVADVKIRDYISIQPGLFYETHSGNYAYIQNLAEGQDQTQVGNTINYALTIPVLCSLHFNVTDNLRWNVDLGPYFTVNLDKKNDGKVVFPAEVSIGGVASTASTNTCEFGFKMGTGLNIMTHYYVGVHYMAGCTRVWNVKPLEGRNKAWTFTVGYDF